MVVNDAPLPEERDDLLVLPEEPPQHAISRIELEHARRGFRRRQPQLQLQCRQQPVHVRVVGGAGPARRGGQQPNRLSVRRRNVALALWCVHASGSRPHATPTHAP